MPRRSARPRFVEGSEQAPAPAGAINGVLGTPTPVMDVRLKVCGQMRYVGDMTLPGMLYGKVLFSPRAHARIVSIDTSAAEAAPGVHAVACHLNAPHALFNSNGEDADILPYERIFDDEVRYVGDHVAAVAAETPEQAAAALKLIRVEYEDLPAYLDPRDAAAPGACPIHANHGSNVLEEVNLSAGDVDAALQQAPLVIEDEFDVPAIHHAPIEPHVSLSSYDASGQLTVYTPTQDAFGQRSNLAKALGLPLSRVRVVNPAMGGGFGGKIDLVNEPMGALLSMLCCRPVKIEYTRAEDIQSSPTRHAEHIRVRAGFGEDGVMTACDYEVYLSAGAHSGATMSVAWAAGGKFFKLFRTPNLRYHAVPCYTDRSSAGAMRGFGSPQLFFALNSVMSEAASRLGLEPACVLDRNLFDPNALDAHGEPLGNFRGRACLARARELAAGWGAATGDPAGAGAAGGSSTNDVDGASGSDTAAGEPGRYLEGVGFAVAPHGSSLYGIMPDTCGVMLKMNEDGSLTMFTGVSDMGNGSTTMQRMIVSEVLGIDAGRIAVERTDTQTTLFDVGAFGSRGTYVGGGAARKAAMSMRRRVLREASELLGVAARELECKGGCVRVRDSATAGGEAGAPGAGSAAAREEGGHGVSVTMAEVARHAHERERDLVVAEVFGTKAAPISAGAHAARVRVDTKTGEVRVLDYVAVHDVGTPLNPLALEGQVDGGIQMGCGYALSEGLELKDDGSVWQRRLGQVGLFRSTDMPRIHVEFLQSREPTGPFGAKSVGECATVPVAGAVANAVADAVGRQFHKLPIRKEDVLCALEESRTPA